MPEEPDPNTEKEQRETRLSIALEEYKSVRAEVSQRLGFQQQVLTFGFGLLGAHLAVFGVLVRDSVVGGAITWIAVSAACAAPLIGLLFCVQDMMIVQLANYEDRELRPELSELAGNPRLQWNGYRGDARLSESKSFLLSVGPRLTMGFPHLLLMAVAVVCMVAAGSEMSASTYDRKASVVQRIDRSTTGSVGQRIGQALAVSVPIAVTYDRPQDAKSGSSLGNQPHWAVLALPGFLLLYYMLVRIVVRSLYRRLWNGTLYARSDAPRVSQPLDE